MQYYMNTHSLEYFSSRVLRFEYGYVHVLVVKILNKSIIN